MNSSSVTYGTISTNGLTLATSAAPSPSGAPAGLLVTRAVETKAGWVGQVIVDKDILWESPAKPTHQRAQELASERVIGRIKELFA